MTRLKNYSQQVKNRRRFNNATSSIIGTVNVFLKSISTDTLLFFIGMNLVFLATLFGNSRLLRGEAAGTDTFRYIAPGLFLLIASGWFAFIKSWGRIAKTRWGIWFPLFALILVCMVLHSIDGGYSVFATIWEAVPYMLVLCAFVGASSHVWSWMLGIVSLHAAVGCIISIVQVGIMNFHSMGLNKQTLRGMYYDTDLGLSIQLLYGAALVVLSWKHGTKWTRYIAVGCLLAFILAAVFGATRSHIKSVCILVALTSFIGLRQEEHPHKFKSFFIYTIMVVFLVGGLFFFGLRSSWGQESGFKNGYELLLERFKGDNEGMIESSTQDYRWFEAGLVLKNLRPMEFLTGRGTAGTWSNPIAFEGKERLMAHVGYVHLIFKGGIPLLLIFCIGPLGLGFFRLFTARNWETLACAGVLVSYAFDMITGGAPEQTLKIVLVFLCFGRCIVDNGLTTTVDVRTRQARYCKVRL